MKKVEDNYPITKKTYPNGEVKEYVSEDDIVAFTPPYQLESLHHFMRGQTMYVEGYYPDDIERWLNNQPNID